MAQLARNYYAMDKDELERVIRDMRGWLWKFTGHEQYSKVWFALEVACAARDLSDDRKTDPFLQEVLDIFV